MFTKEASDIKIVIDVATIRCQRSGSLLLWIRLVVVTSLDASTNAKRWSHVISQSDGPCGAAWRRDVGPTPQATKGMDKTYIYFTSHFYFTELLTKESKVKE